MTKAEEKRLAPILRAVAATNLDGLGAMAEAEIARLKRQAPKKVIQLHKKAAPKRAEVIGPILQAARDRSGGYCENCGCYPPSLILDHWLGGSGRRQEEERLETVWMLCAVCNRNRTANWPSAAYWNTRFLVHCHKYGYPFTPHIEHNLGAK